MTCASSSANSRVSRASGDSVFSSVKISRAAGVTGLGTGTGTGTVSRRGDGAFSSSSGSFFVDANFASIACTSCSTETGFKEGEEAKFSAFSSFANPVSGKTTFSATVPSSLESKSSSVSSSYPESSPYVNTCDIRPGGLVSSNHLFNLKTNFMPVSYAQLVTASEAQCHAASGAAPSCANLIFCMDPTSTAST